MHKYVQQLMFLGSLLLACGQLQAQATLSVQGNIIQNFTGAAIDNGTYDITFKLYTTDTGGSPLWSETQSVNMIGGVYSVLLGAVNPLNLPFDQTYYLGLTLPGGPEHTPRTQLTASPYALSLLGQDNKFPSTGMVKMEAVATGQAATTATSYAVTADDHVIFLDHTANQNVTLPAATTANAGRHLVLVNKEAVAKILTSSNYQNIEGASSTTIPAKSVIELQSDGSAWRQTGGYVTPVAAAKAFVLAAPTANATYQMNQALPLAITEVEDAQNCFANNTFTAPRTGFYRVTLKYIGISNGNWSLISGSNGPRLLIRSTGTCAWGAANRVLGDMQQEVGQVMCNVDFSADLYFVAGQTLSFQIASSTGTVYTIATFGYQNDGSWLTILEQ